jgi:hypothetical protein
MMGIAKSPLGSFYPFKKLKMELPFPQFQSIALASSFSFILQAKA